MERTIKMRATLVADKTDVQVLIRHPMDSGFGKNPDNTEISPHYIQAVTVQYAGKTVFAAEWGPLIAKDPYLRFSFEGGERGGEVKATWIDNLGSSDSTVERIQ